MAEPSLIQVFGANATQTATQLVISKADLAEVGLTALATNTAESLFTALFLKSSRYLNTISQTTNPDIQVTIADSFQNIVTRNEQNYRQRVFNANFEELLPTDVLDPDNY